MQNLQSLQNLIAAGSGRIPCDLILRNATYLDVFSCQWRTGDLSIYDGRIIGVEPGLKGRREIDIKGKFIVPGFIDAHVHIESSMMIPYHFQNSVLKCGTTTAICDPHELANVAGVPGIQYFLDSALQSSMNLWVMLSSCVPATHIETNGGGTITAEDLRVLKPHPRALGLAEMMNVPGVLGADPEVLQKIEFFKDHIIDGHSPLLSGQALSTYISAGISSCHECTQLDEAKEKVSKGMSVWIREGSAAKDLHRLASVLNIATSTSVGFCTDDRNPYDISEEGHVDYLVRESIRIGIPAEIAYRSSSWSVARHYGLTQGPHRTGAIAPGFCADLVLLEDFATCSIENTFKNGIPIEEIQPLPLISHDAFKSSIRAKLPEASELECDLGRDPSASVNVIGILEGKIITEKRVKPADSRGIAKISVLERYGKGSKPANAYVEGFGENFNGAIGSSVGHDSHNLIVVGSNTEDMRVALAQLIECGGGYCIVQKKEVLSNIPLPIGGLMSEKTPEDLKQGITQLRQASRAIGCTLNEPFIQLAFLSLPVIPSLKLTDRGLVDVSLGKVISVRI